MATHLSPSLSTLSVAMTVVVDRGTVALHRRIVKTDTQRTSLRHVSDVCGRRSGAASDQEPVALCDRIAAESNWES